MYLWLVSLFLLFLQNGLSQSQRIPIDFDEGRIVGGQPTSIEQHPYQVSLRYNNRHVCGGAIISKDWIITAAHCVQSSRLQYVSIKAGTSNLSTRGTVIHAKEIIVHNAYKRWNSDYDIAVIQLERPLSYGPRIKPISLASAIDDYVTGSIAMVTGWGMLKSNGLATNQLHKVEVPIVSDTECSRVYKRRMITSRMLCAGYVNTGGKDACQGDSGGPLTQYGYLIGIVSWGYGCAEPGYPGVYTRVAALRDWIMEQTGV